MFTEYLLSARHLARSWGSTGDLSTLTEFTYSSVMGEEGSKQMNTKHVCVYFCVYVHVCVHVASMLVAQMLTDLSKVTEMPLDLNPVVKGIANNYISAQ